MLKELVKQLKNDPNIIGAYLFGSHGTEKETPLSDIDICLFTKTFDKKSILNFYSYGTEKIDISIFNLLPVYIKPEVFKGKPLFIKNNNFINKQFASSFREFQDFKPFYDRYIKRLKRRFR
ncbi:MAG: nucleotidyltransferase domain-containing protein [Candidatus Woesearchaeota archaeon]